MNYQIKKNQELAKCFCCGQVADLSHIILECESTRQIHEWIVIGLELDPPLEQEQWVLGYSKSVNPLLWLLNFALHKAHLVSVEGQVVVLKEVVKTTLCTYVPLFPNSHVSEML